MRERADAVAALPRLDEGGSLGRALGAGARAPSPRGEAADGTGRGRQRLGAGRFGGAHTGPNGTDRAKPGCKRHLVVDAVGHPLSLDVSPANLREGCLAVDLLDAIPAIRGKVGRPVQRPAVYQGDRGYGWKVNIDAVRQRGVRSQLARPQDKAHGSGLGKTRWVVEAALSWMNNFRRLRVCYERTREHWLGINRLAAALICWRKALRPLVTGRR